MKSKYRLFYILMLFFAPAIEAKVNVVTTIPDLAWAVREVGGNHVQVVSLLKGVENAHFVDAVPEFVRLVSEAQVVCLVGLDLEVGWLPKVLTRSGNAAVQPGGKGYCDVGTVVTVLEKPVGRVERSMGDVHPAGNPHFWLSPKSMIEATQKIVDVLRLIDPAHAGEFMTRQRQLTQRLEAVISEGRALVAQALAQAKAAPILEFHREFSYFANVYGIPVFGTLEEKPGVPPSAGRIAEVAMIAKSAQVRLLFAADYYPIKTMEKFKEASGIPFVAVATMIRGDAGDYIAHQKHLIATLLRAYAQH